MFKLRGKQFGNEEYIQEIFCLDNFSAFGAEIDGVKYKTAEHAFQAVKFLKTAPDIAKQICESNSPYDARELAQVHKKLRRADWSEVKYEIMEEILTAKAKQNPIVKERLSKTKGYEIIEDCGEDDDKDWGCGLDGTGENNLGEIWMRIRDKIKNNSEF